MGLVHFYINFLEPSGQRQFCNGAAILLTLLPGTLWAKTGL